MAKKKVQQTEKSIELKGTHGRRGKVTTIKKTTSTGSLIQQPAAPTPKPTVKQAVSGGKAGKGWKDKMVSLYKAGASVEDLASKGHGTKEGLSNLLKDVKRDTPAQPTQPTGKGVGSEYSSKVQTEMKSGYGPQDYRTDMRSQKFLTRTSQQMDRKAGRKESRAKAILKKHSITKDMVKKVTENEDGTMDYGGMTPKQIKQYQRAQGMKKAAGIARQASKNAQKQSDDITRKIEQGRAAKDYYRSDVVTTPGEDAQEKKTKSITVIQTNEGSDTEPVKPVEEKEETAAPTTMRSSAFNMGGYGSKAGLYQPAKQTSTSNRTSNNTSNNTNAKPFKLKGLNFGKK